MKKLLFLLISISLVFASCTDVEINIDLDDSVAGEANVSVVQVTLREDTSTGYDASLDIDLLFERPDLGLKQPEGGGGIMDLPIQLQVKSVYISDVTEKGKNVGQMCYEHNYPHQCSVMLENQDITTDELDFLIKVTFEDGVYAEIPIAVPVPPLPEMTEIVWPEDAPEQSTTLEMRFNDVGADSYLINVNLCHPYANDGINPCLYGVEYSIERSGDGFVFEYEDEFTSPEVALNNGLVEVTSNFPILYNESAEYIVKAVWEKTTKKVPTRIESTVYKNFSLLD